MKAFMTLLCDPYISRKTKRFVFQLIVNFLLGELLTVIVCIAMLFSFFMVMTDRWSETYGSRIFILSMVAGFLLIFHFIMQLHSGIDSDHTRLDELIKEDIQRRKEEMNNGS